MISFKSNLQLKAAAELEIRKRKMQEAEAYKYDWLSHARKKQIMPEKFIWWLLMAGRGFGKTRTVTESARILIDNGKAKNIAIAGRTPADVRDVLIQGRSGFLNIYPPWQKPKYLPSKGKIIFHNGAEGFLYSSENPEKARGPEHDLIIADEIATWRTRELWDNLLFGIRIKGDVRIIAATTPRPVSLVRELYKKDSVIKTTGSSYENSDNLSDIFVEDVLGQFEGTKKGRQEIYAELLEDIDGALWRLSWIDNTRFEEAPFSIYKKVVAIDPATTSKETSDETGIVVCGKDLSSHGYLLADLSIRGTPKEWATIAVNAYHKYKCNLIIAESNQGGEMIQQVIREIDPNIKVELVWASSGKRARAEPISLLYEQGKCHHVGDKKKFTLLEDELITWDASTSTVSPNRLDALVWAFSHLLLDKKKSKEYYINLGKD